MTPSSRAVRGGLRLAHDFIRAMGGCLCIEPGARDCIVARWKRHGWGHVPDGKTCECSCHAHASQEKNADG